MKKLDENNAYSRKYAQKTPFENAADWAIKRALLAQIYEDTRNILASYEHFQDVAKTTGMSVETLEKYANDAIIELAQTMEKEFGVCAWTWKKH